MSRLLELALRGCGDTQRLRDLAANDEHIERRLSLFKVVVKQGAFTRLQFEAMARTRREAQIRHEVLCEPGEQCVAYPVEVRHG